jgi:hypothetical protein
VVEEWRRAGSAAARARLGRWDKSGWRSALARAPWWADRG